MKWTHLSIKYRTYLSWRICSSLEARCAKSWALISLTAIARQETLGHLKSQVHHTWWSLLVITVGRASLLWNMYFNNSCNQCHDRSPTAHAVPSRGITLSSAITLNLSRLATSYFSGSYFSRTEIDNSAVPTNEPTTHKNIHKLKVIEPTAILHVLLHLLRRIYLNVWSINSYFTEAVRNGHQSSFSYKEGSSEGTETTL
jgi:hypothetical protein